MSVTLRPYAPPWRQGTGEGEGDFGLVQSAEQKAIIEVRIKCNSHEQNQIKTFLVNTTEYHMARHMKYKQISGTICSDDALQ